MSYGLSINYCRCLFHATHTCFYSFSVKNFNALRKQKLEQQASLRRQELTEQRSILIRDGQLSPAVIKVLKKIFFSYAGRSEDSPPSEPLLDILTASRLWYRCGLVLSELGMLADEKAAAAEGAVRDIGISFDEFIECVKSVIEDEEAVFVDSLEEGPPSYEVRRWFATLSVEQLSRNCWLTPLYLSLCL